MSHNHLIIGLGGTGAKIIRELRKSIFQQFRKESPDEVNVEYLYIDSSDQDMGLDNEDWKILGTSVQLGNKNQLLITEGDLPSRVDNSNQYPGIKGWLGDKALWLPYLRTIQGTKAAAGQRRRLGRFLFACNVDRFKAQLDLLVGALHRAGSDTAVNFHVCSGLAGGTGSGSIVDVVAQIRASYPTRKDRILLYTLLPESHPNPSWALSGYYQANGYAALLELNALSVGAWNPHDLTGRQERLELSDPFNGCYVFTHENENGVPVDIVKELPAIVADFLFQKIVAVKDAGNWEELGRMENAENGDSKPETTGRSIKPERSKRFLAFGIKRLAIPEQEITEYLTYSFARQAVLQLRFNNWTGSSGFIDEAKNQDVFEFVRSRETQARWVMTDEQLCLSEGILPEDVGNKRWKTIEAEWLAVMPNFKSLVATNYEEKFRLDELTNLCERRYNQDYRGFGVTNFYANKLRARRDHAREIRRRVEEELFQDWRNGVRSMSEVSRILAALRETLEERLRAFDDRINNLKSDHERIFAGVTANAQEWAGVGKVQNAIFQKRERIFDAQAVALQALYTCRTRIAAFQFAKKLAEELIAEIDDLKGQVDQAASTVSAALKGLEEGIAQRCNDSAERFDYKKELIRFYNSEAVKKTTGALTRDENEQKTQAGRIRQALAERLGEHPTFSLFNERITRTVFADTLEKQAKENAEIAHNTLVVDPKDKLLGVSILEKLRERYTDEQELRTFVAELIKHAGNFAIFNEAEQKNVEAGVPTQICVRSFAVLLPKSNDEFVKTLTGAFERGMPGGRGGVQFVATSSRPNEICLVSLTNLLPLRTLQLVKFLSERYNDVLRTAPNPAEARMFLHLEGDGTKYPSLFARSAKAESAPYLLLGKVLGLITSNTSATTGTTSLMLITRDQYGLDHDPIDLGKSLADAVETLDAAGLQELIDAIDTELKSSEWLHVDKREQLRQAMVAEVQAVKLLRNNDLQDPVYKKFNEAARKAIDLFMKI
jgi:Tubulin like